MACGSSCGLAANGRRLTAPGLVFRAAYCMSDFEPGSSKAFGNRYSALCCVSMVANDASSGNGNRETVDNPTDRAKKGSKIHILVDQHGAPLSVWITGANQHDKWSLEDLVIHMLVKRPTSDQHLCADKGYDYPDVHQFVTEQGYQKHIKHRRRRGEPKPGPCPIPGETQFPARRWVVERTIGWLAKRRSIRIRWCKKSQNWLSFVHFAWASILADMAIFG